MSFKVAAACCACGLSAACASERAPNPDREASASVRSESNTLALPSDPKALGSILGVPADSLRVAGEERYRRQEYDSARAIWRIELIRAEALTDAPAAARVRMWLGLVAYKLGDFKSAQLEGEKSLAMKRQLHMDSELARSFNALGLLAWQEGRLRVALEYFDSAQVAARRNHDATGVARALSNSPLVQVELGDFETARKGFFAALSAGKEIDDDLIQGNALANLGMLEIRLGNATRAVALLGDARKHYRAIENGAQEANALGQLATAWSALGDLQRAIAAADSALKIARVEGLQQEVAAEFEVLADLQVQAGSPQLALRRLAEADSIDRRIGLHLESGTNLRRAAAILTDLGEYPAAIARAREAASVHHGVEARAEEIYDRLQLAQALSLNNHPTQARLAADGAAQDAQRMGNQAVTRAVAVIAARLALDAKDPKRALKYLAVASPSATPADWRVADLRAEALLAVGRLDDARAEGERAVAALEHERGSLGIGPLRSGYLARRSSPFSNLVAIHLARHDSAAAFAVAASLPGRSLSERLGGVGDVPRSLGAVTASEKLLLRAATLERAVDSARDEQNNERTSALQRELATVRAAYEDQVARLAVAPAASMLGLVPVDLKDVQSRLANDEAVVTFLSGPTRLDLFVLRREFYRHASVPIGDRAIAQRVRLAREILARSRRTPDVPVVLGELYDLLLGPAERAGGLVGAKRLLIVPHGALGALPFAALWNRRSGKFVVEEKTISYLPAISALTLAPHIARNFPNRLVVFAPLPDSLPGTLKETRAIVSMNPGAEERIGSASTESAVKAALRAGASVHIASHGSHNSQNPLFSRMIVGGTRRSRDADDDGRLDVHEILGLKTRSPLVFLSGCETGLSSGTESAFDPGSDEGSLAQAFLIAGAQTVVATLWRVEDVEAALVAKSFYQQTRVGATHADALAISQRDAIKRGSGYSWAAYTASGTPTRKSGNAVRKTTAGY